MEYKQPYQRNSWPQVLHNHSNYFNNGLLDLHVSFDLCTSVSVSCGYSYFTFKVLFSEPTMYVVFGNCLSYEFFQNSNKIWQLLELIVKYCFLLKLTNGYEYSSSYCICLLLDSWLKWIFPCKCVLHQIFKNNVNIYLANWHFPEKLHHAIFKHDRFV